MTHTDDLLELMPSDDGRPYLRAAETGALVAKTYRDSVRAGVLPGQDNAERIKACWNALAGIPSVQIERDKELYAHVAEMAARLKLIREQLMDDNWPGAQSTTRHISPGLLAKLEESQ